MTEEKGERLSVSYGIVHSGYTRRLCRRVWELCGRYGISERMLRLILPGDRGTLNRHIVESLANQGCWLELDTAPGQGLWACCKAAWAIEDLPVLAVQARGMLALPSTA